MSGVEFFNISKGFGGTPILRDVSLSVAEGEFVTLLGPSGCGKSTLLRILAGLEPSDEGEIFIRGRRVDGMRPKARDVAMVFQSYALYPHMSVAKNIALPLRMRRLNSWQRFPLVGKLLPGTAGTTRAIEAEIARTADALGIGHLLDRKPGQLSGGQRQRVAVGRAMVREPAVFLMDEPLSNLDAKLRVQMRAEIKDLRRRLGVTFIYVTHDQAEAMTMSDRVAVMLDGSLLQTATPHDIYADPDDRRVAEFVGSPKINMLETVLQADLGIRLGSLRLIVPIDQPVGASITLGVRPEAFRPTSNPEAAAISGAIAAVEHMGSDIFVYLAVASQPDMIVVRLPTEDAPRLQAGQQLNLTVQPEQILIFGPDGRRIRLPTSVQSLRNYA